MSFLDPVLGPLLNLPILWAVIIVSLIITSLMTIVYKWMTDQNMMKELKAEIKSLQKEMKEFKEHPAKMMELQKKAMERNMKYMTHSLKPTLITFIPIILVFGWLHGHLGYMPIMPDQEFSTSLEFVETAAGNVSITVPEAIEILNGETQVITNGIAEWKLVASDPGEYTLEYMYGDKSYIMDVIITTEHAYGVPITKVKDGVVNFINVGYEKVILLNLFGWKIGWLGTYIIFSIAFSMTLRKLLKVH